MYELRCGVPAKRQAVRRLRVARVAAAPETKADFEYSGGTKDKSARARAQ